MFKELITALTPIWKLMGFSKRGDSFYLHTVKNYVVVNFQKSRESTKEILKFTINFGIYSDVLGQLDYDYNGFSKPEIEQCHWRARVGDFMPGSPDYWWIVNTSDKLDKITANVIETVQTVIVPEIIRRSSDEGLINTWINDSYAGTTEIGKFKYLTTLLKVKEEFEILKQVIQEFMQKSKGKPNASIAMEHLKEHNIFIK